MATIKLKAIEELKAKHSRARDAALIYEYSVESANALWAAYDLARENRGKPRGITTDQEQDLLRAMLVAAASGLDAALKQLIRDALPSMIKRNTAVHKEFERFAQKRISIKDPEGDSVVSAKILARILAAPDPQKRLIEDYIFELTGDSLQSPDQLFKVCNVFDLDVKELNEKEALKAVFIARNQIIHELDMNLDSPNRKRRLRSQADMQAYAELLLKLCHSIISATDAQFD